MSVWAYLSAIATQSRTPTGVPSKEPAHSPHTYTNPILHAPIPEEREEEPEKLCDQTLGAQVATGTAADAMSDEKTPLLQENKDLATEQLQHKRGPKASLGKRIASGVVGTFRVIISAILAPGQYLIACFYDEKGQFSAALPVYRIGRALSRKNRRRAADVALNSKSADAREKRTGQASAMAAATRGRRSNSRESSHDPSQGRSHQRHPRAPSTSSTQSAEESDASSVIASSKPKRSIRIKTINEEVLRERERDRNERALNGLSANGASPATENSELITAESLKSPRLSSSPSRLTRYPRRPAPPRPLIPRRQPSFSNAPTYPAPQKTLVIDLDETLIHSMAKGGRMSTGHMVEVRLSAPVGIGASPSGNAQGGTIIGPQVPILYYVHKRPHCDEFLRKVSKWYNLVIFTASVQEYADPVIDWLELERKYFSARYYRQHCTFRNGAYVKDLGCVEPDLSRVMILDNSPMSYVFHEDNAIPIEGWISDPTDSDLLHLVPLLEALQHTTDVRSLLSLRLGEALWEGSGASNDTRPPLGRRKSSIAA